MAVGGDAAPDVAPDGAGGSGAGGSGAGETEGSGDGAARPADPAQPGGADGADGADGAANGGGAPVVAVPHPPRDKAAPVDTTTAKKFYFDGEIRGNSIVVQVPLSRAAELAKYANADRDGAKLRYVDVNGQIIKGVKRDVNIGSRTLTLTYPEGETPDNPFIMEVVRDDAVSEFIAVITATNAPVEAEREAEPEAGESDAKAENPYGDIVIGQGESPDSGGGAERFVPLAIGGVGLLVLLALLIAALRRRGTARA